MSTSTSELHFSSVTNESLSGVVERITYHSDESGLIKGVGPVTAKRIVAHFGLETLDIIENQIERLSEVKGIAKKRVAQIQKTWNDQKTSTSLESPALG